MNVQPRFSVPVGENADSFTYGYGAELETMVSLKALPFLSLGLEAGYTYLPLDITQSEDEVENPESTLSFIDYGLGLRAALPLGERVSLYARGTASACTIILTGHLDESATTFKYKAGGGMSLLLNKNFALQAATVFSSLPNYYNDVSISLGLTTRFSGPGSHILPKRDFTTNQPIFIPSGGNIQFYNVEIAPLFPVLYKYYFNHPVGTAVISNTGDEPLEDVEIRLSLSQYMDNPELSARIETLAPGEEQTVDLSIFFNYSVLSITEGAKLAGELKADYKIGGHQISDTATVVIDTFDRNAMRWDDDRKLATFITARDEEIQRYARNIASVVRDHSLSGFSTEFQQGIAYLAAMDLTGCAYVIDPSSSYAELSANTSAVDAVQFPRQTLEYRAGDCDDLTTTYCTLLEAVGVKTAFITVPGHIYSAFQLNMTKNEAASAFSRSDDLIIDEEDQVWVPVETTALGEGFLKAWEIGAAQWREHSLKDAARLNPTAEAWSIYSPVAFKVSDSGVESPPAEEFSSAFRRELAAYVDREIAVREEIYMARLESNPGHSRTLNSLGVLYARYDRQDEAASYFQQAASGERPYVPALVNLGNMSYLQEDYFGAGSYYQKALNLNQKSSGAVLGLARVSHALNNFAEAREQYRELEKLSPDLARRFAYLDSESEDQNRASDYIQMSSRVAWDEEDE